MLKTKEQILLDAALVQLSKDSGNHELCGLIRQALDQCTTARVLTSVLASLGRLSQNRILPPASLIGKVRACLMVTKGN